MRAVVLLLIVGLAGCASRDNPNAAHSLVREVDLIGGQKLVICSKDPAVCEEQAARTCPTGYNVLRTNLIDPDPSRKSIVIRCT